MTAPICPAFASPAVVPDAAPASVRVHSGEPRIIDRAMYIAMADTLCSLVDLQDVPKGPERQAAAGRAWGMAKTLVDTLRAGQAPLAAAD